MSRILIVEDTAAHMQLATQLLERNGHTVLQASTAEDGIMLARSQQPDVVLMDIKLPRMDGFSAIRALRQDPATHGLKLIAITSYREEFAVDEARASGADGFIAKPFHYEHFLAVLNEVLAR